MNRSIRHGAWLGLLVLAACSQNGGASAPVAGDPGGQATVPGTAPASGPGDRLILIDGYPIDTTQPDAMYRLVPARLRTGDMRRALAGLTAPRGGLYLIQFTGPVLDDGLRAI